MIGFVVVVDLKTVVVYLSEVEHTRSSLNKTETETRSRW